MEQNGQNGYLRGASELLGRLATEQVDECEVTSSEMGELRS